ncbi:MAG: hypothetical protein KGN02_05580 [bacterium]|nr:hypothetical protein [bacterium]
MQQRSSVLVEIGWLGLFLAIFAILVYAFNLVLVPHHFNDKIAIMLAAVFAGVAMIAARAYSMRRSR